VTAWDRPPRVIGAAVQLRAYRDDDAAALDRAFLDPAIARWNPGPTTPDAAAAWVARRNDWSTGDHASWAVADEHDQLVGSVSLHRLDPVQADAEVGYWTAPWARARGVATAAVELATWFAHTKLELNRVYLYHAVSNEASCRVAVAAGFRLAGTLLRAYRYADGDFHDEHLHAHLPDDPGIAAAALAD
jgi:RimJ/RimL family protein N-acetyltransferase